MKKALMDFNGAVADIVDPGEEYVLFLGRGCSQMWVNAPDDITKDWTLEWSPSANDAIWVKRTDAYSDPGTIRKVAYGEVGEQLDMLYKDLAAGKALDAGDALWFNHIKAIKENTTSPSSVAEPMDPTMTDDEIADFMGDAAEPATTRPAKRATIDAPIWERFSGWGRTYDELGT
jgi:hypothetical protein|tara:strand:+ start:5737 stop:6261 length:525 start_codon:yes stop_codon:yes gene_type:complete